MSATTFKTPPPECGKGLPASFIAHLSPSVSNKLILVTGGAGFLGGHIVSVLLQSGARVRIFDVCPPREGHGVWGKNDPVDVVVGDLLNAQQVKQALTDCFAVIHVASPSPTSKNAELFWNVNVKGTTNLIEQCKAAGIQRFVFTSSASVVFDGKDQMNLSEKFPPPVNGLDDYTQSKLAAEKVVLQSTSATFWTCSIRPHGIFGPRDPHLLPVLAATGAKGKSRYQIGDGSNLVDFTYAENVAYAHVLALTQLTGPQAKINGQAYFITNREPIYFWELFRRIYKGWGFTEPFIALPVAMMRPMSRVFEALGRTFNFKPTFTTQAVNYASVHHYYSSEKAVKEMNYQPPISMDEAIRRSLAHYWHLSKKKDDTPNTKAPAKKKAAGGLHPCLSTLLYFVGITVAVLLLTPCWFQKVFLVLLALYLIISFRYSSFCPPWGTLSTYEVDEVHNSMIIITGGNRGLGFHTAQELVNQFHKTGKMKNSTILLACRDATSAESAAASLNNLITSSGDANGNKVEVASLDLASLESVRKFVDNYKQKYSSSHPTIRLLIHNAGAMLSAATTKDGMDAQFQSNYASHFYLTHLLLKNKLLAPAARIVNVSSMMHRLARHLRVDDLSMTKKDNSYNRVMMYCQTKLCQVMFTYKLQRLFNSHAEKIAQQPINSSNASQLVQFQPEANRRTVIVVNPGAVSTDFITYFIPRWLASLVNPFLDISISKTPTQAAQSVLYAALSAQMNNVGGVYVDNFQTVITSKQSRDEDLQEELYQQTCQLCNIKPSDFEKF